MKEDLSIGVRALPISGCVLGRGISDMSAEEQYSTKPVSKKPVQDVVHNVHVDRGAQGDRAGIRRESGRETERQDGKNWHSRSFGCFDCTSLSQDCIGPEREVRMLLHGPKRNNGPVIVTKILLELHPVVVVEPHFARMLNLPDSRCMRRELHMDRQLFSDVHVLVDAAKLESRDLPPCDLPGLGTEVEMRLGTVLTADPPLQDQVELALLAEANGFDDVYCWDSHILKQEALPLMSLLAVKTDRVGLGWCVTNHVTRHPSVTAGFFATLATMIGGDRLTCGIGSGGSAVRAWGARPGTLAALETAVHVIQRLTGGEDIEIDATSVKLEWATGGRVPVLVAASGPKSLRLAGRAGDGVVLTAADPVFVKWCLDQVRKGWDDAGRDGTDFRVQVAVPGCVSSDMAQARAQVAWFPAFIGRHVGNILRSHDVSDAGSDIWGYIDEDSAGEYRQRGAPGERPAVDVPDDVVDRVTIIGNPAQTVSRIRELEAIGVTEVAIYLSSDEPSGLIEAYGREVIPAFAANGA